MSALRRIARATLVLLALAAAVGTGWLLAWGWLASRAAPERVATRSAEPEVQPRLAREPIGAPPAQRSGLDLQRRAVELNNRATALLAEERLDEALELLREALALDGDNETFRHNTAEVLARIAVRERAAGEDLALCIDFLEEALVLAPGRDDLARLVGRWRDEADVEHGFHEDLSQHFELSYDGWRSDLLHGSQHLLDVLEDAYADFSELYRLDPVGIGQPRLRVVIYSKAGFDRLTGLGDWAAGAFDGTVRVPVEDLSAEASRLDGVLRHELSHAFTRAAGGGAVPGWLNEGLAQWLESREVGRARGRLAGAQLFELSELAGSLAGWSDADRVRDAYAQSLAFVAHLARNYGDEVLYQMVRGSAQGRTPDETFQAAWLVSLDTVLDDLAVDLAAGR